MGQTQDDVTRTIASDPVSRQDPIQLALHLHGHDDDGSTTEPLEHSATSRDLRQIIVVARRSRHVNQDIRVDADPYHS